GAGEDDSDRILGPWRAGLLVGDAAPQIDHRLTADGQAHRGADLAVGIEVFPEGFGDALETRLAGSVGHFGIGSLKASIRKRAAADSAVSLMPWPTPSAMCSPTCTPVSCSTFAACWLSACGSISSWSPCASRMGGRDLISSFRISGPASMPEN